MRDKDVFKRQAGLLIAVVPYLKHGACFALHGGTAINMFYRDMPRLSVDIDLTVTDKGPRRQALETISSGLKAVASAVKKGIPGSVVQELKGADDGLVKKLFVRSGGVSVKIEPNQVIRGTLEQPLEMELCSSAQAEFEKYAAVTAVSFAEVYGSKICAALDRQHPRDLFDIMLLLENEGITEKIRKVFLVFLISHNRPMAELLKPNLKDLRAVYEREFEGMTSISVSHERLSETRNSLIKKINGEMTDKERKFLLSFKNMAPEWELLGTEGAGGMPAVKWKLENLAKMKSEKHKNSADELKKILGI